MAQGKLMNDVESKMANYPRVGEILAAIKSNNLFTSKELVEYFMNERKITGTLRRQELDKVAKEKMSLNPGGLHGDALVKGKKEKFDVDAVALSLRDWESKLKEILHELKIHFPEHFEDFPEFEKKLP